MSTLSAREKYLKNIEDKKKQQEMELAEKRRRQKYNPNVFGSDLNVNPSKYEKSYTREPKKLNLQQKDTPKKELQTKIAKRRLSKPVQNILKKQTSIEEKQTDELQQKWAERREIEEKKRIERQQKLEELIKKNQKFKQQQI